MSYEFKDEALELVTIQEDGTLEVTEKGVDFLSSLGRVPLSILSVIGPPASGKSFLSGALLNKINSFKTSEKTKGIWVWNNPIELPNKSKLLLLDFQGLGKNEQESVSQKLFLISLLLSTSVIYLSSGELNESSVDFMSSFAESCKKISIEPGKPATFERLSEYLPKLILGLNDFQSDKKENLYLEEALDKFPKAETIKKLFLNRTCVFLPKPTDDDEKNKNLQNETLESLSPGYVSKVKELFEGIKNEIKVKKVNNFDIDGESLFGILQNFLDSLNVDESPSINQSIDNVLLSKGKYISEKVEDEFKTELNKKFEGKFPISFDEIYKGFFELQDKFLVKFCEEVQGTLTVKQAGDYCAKICQRMRTELDSVFESNKEYYDEWIDINYKEIEKSLSGQNFTKVEEIKGFFSIYLTTFQNGLGKFVDMPNTEFNKNILILMGKIFQDFVSSKFIKIAEQVNDVYTNYQKETQQNIDSLNANIKRLNDQTASDKKIFEEKSKEKSELNRTFIELETKYDKLVRETKSKEKEYENNISIEAQKFNNMEAYYKNQLKEKESAQANIESKIEKLNKELAETSKESSNKINELNRENLKLHVEIEKLKSQEKKIKSENFEGEGGNLQTQFKAIQTTFSEFRDSLEKLNRENEIVFKTKEIEYSAKEMENKSRNWIDEIKQYKEEQLHAMNENYEKLIQKIKNEVEEVNFELTKKEYSLNEQIQQTERWMTSFNEVNKQLEREKEIIKLQEDAMKTQDENVKLLEGKVEDLNKGKEDLEMQLNTNIINFKMKEDELETLVSVIEGIASGKKETYEHNLDKLSNDIKKVVQDIVSKSKKIEKILK